MTRPDTSISTEDAMRQIKQILEGLPNHKQEEFFRALTKDFPDWDVRVNGRRVNSEH